MMRRSPQARAFGGALVFPGGTLDSDDSGMHWPQANAVNGILDEDKTPYAVAAIRECFEEGGLLLAEDAQGRLVDIGQPELADAFSELRVHLNAGEISFKDLLDRLGLRPALGRLAYLSHWVTPLHVAHRFDTRFFVAPAPFGQIPSHDQYETIEHLWIRPMEALARHEREDFPMVLATKHTLETLARHSSVDGLMRELSQSRPPVVNLPRLAKSRQGQKFLLPQDYAYAEVAKLDPRGEGIACGEIVSGVPVRLSSRIVRLTAPNPGYMTGPGTNTYLLGTGNDIAVIDPGPEVEDHVAKIVETARGMGQPGRIRWILATHTHLDHSSAVRRLKAATGAEVLGLPPPPYDRQDQTFVPDRQLHQGEHLNIAGCSLRVIHTPGHASNHLCYLLEEEKILFTGDHLMQGSTVVINPPDGDMAVYLDSLRAVRAEDLEYLAPGHGFLMEKHRDLIDALLAHRLKREEKVLATLRQLGTVSIRELLPRVYDDVPAAIHPVAERSLLAHLIKLQSDGLVVTKNNNGFAPASLA